jgi:hypothetical protein
MSRTDLQTLPERAVELLGGEPDDTTLRRYLHGLPGVDAVGLEQRAAGLGTRSIKTTSKAWALDKIIELIDLTTLEGSDTPGKVRSLVAKALTPDASDPTCPRVAAVCVYGDMVPYAVAALGAAHGDPDDGLVSVAAVATAFPSGRAVARDQTGRHGGCRRRRRRRDRHGDRPRGIPRRPLRARVRPDRPREAGVPSRRRNLRLAQGDPRNG